MESADNGISRRNFLRGGAAVAAVAVGSGLVGCSSAPKQAAWEPGKWDEETDVVVVGYGGAGIAAAITMKSEGLGDVVVLEAAPKEFEGGNTRVSGNIMFQPETADAAFNYQKYLNGEYEVDDNLLKAWSVMMVDNIQWLKDLGGNPQTIPRTAEFAEAPDADKVKIYCIDGEYGNASLWNMLKTKEEPLGYTVHHEARVKSLICNPETNEACGAVAEMPDGTTLTVKARKAVILSCGGFENNAEMVKTYYHIGAPYCFYYGTPWNKGDGFNLVAPFGAKLWHMNNFSGGHLATRVSKDEGFTSIPKIHGKNWIYVGADSTRFLYEETTGEQRHGKIRFHGTWTSYPSPQPIHLIAGEGAITNNYLPNIAVMWPSQGPFWPSGKGADIQQMIKDGIIAKADTIEELAKKIQRDPVALAATINQYNEYCAAGVDPDFHRGESFYEYGKTGIGNNEGAAAVMKTEKVEVIKPFALEPINPPYYAIETRTVFINSQGGPMRNENCQILDTNEQPIPRLYGCGEFGSIYSSQYNGGGNVSEAIATGRTAARHAGTLEAWDKKKA
ncbi:MAG: FAD-binding protein [Raoultibacter sp.]